MRSSTTGRDLSSARVGRQAHSGLSCHRGQCNGVDHFPKGLLKLSESRYYGFFAKSDNGSGLSLCFETAAATRSLASLGIVYWFLAVAGDVGRRTTIECNSVCNCVFRFFNILYSAFTSFMIVVWAVFSFLT